MDIKIVGLNNNFLDKEGFLTKFSERFSEVIFLNNVQTFAILTSNRAGIY